MTKLKDIAERLSVAPSTVSKALNGAEDISEELRQQIIDTAVEMGYITKKMKKEKHRKLAIFLKDIPYEKKTDEGYSYIMGFKQLAQKSHWSVEMITLTEEMQNERKYDAYMLRHGFGGAFFIGITPEDVWFSQFDSCRTPAVVLDVPACGSKVATLALDGTQIFSEIISHLAEFGHSHIAYLSGPNNSTNDVLREAFTKACSLAGLSKEDCPIGTNCVSPEAAEEFVYKFVDTGATAFICASDLVASGIYSESELLGYKIPTDISVVGFGDNDCCQTLSPALSSVHIDLLLVGKTAFNTLSGLLEHLPIQNVTYKASLTLRNSTGSNSK